MHSARKIEHCARTIHPGSWAVGTEQPLSTLLGSCVAVCLFDPLSRIGGLNHFMLPSMRRRGGDDSMLSGELAMGALLDAVLHRGARRAQLLAKAFGGGQIFETGDLALDIGQRNASFAKQWLRDAGIPLSAADLLGPWSRKLLFFPDSGDALCRRMLTSMTSAALSEGEDVACAEAFGQMPLFTNNRIESA